MCCSCEHKLTPSGLTGRRLPTKRPGPQEMGWFDVDEHASGAVAGRLATDAACLRGAVGDQLGIIAQNLVTCIAAFTLGAAHSRIPLCTERIVRVQDPACSAPRSCTESHLCTEKTCAMSVAHSCISC